MSHPEAVELLPWLVNGTLSGEEAGRVREQLRESEPLRRELRETVETARLLAEPPSVEAVIDFATGRPTPDAELIERLVETHPEWAEQVQLARRSFALQDESIVLLGGQRHGAPAASRPVRTPGFWRPLAIAASLAAVVSSVGWMSGWPAGWLDSWRSGGAPSAAVGTPWQTRTRPALPQPNVTVLDLVASSFIRRDAGGEAGRQNVRLSELGDSLVLILASDSDRAFDRYELELAGPGGTSNVPELQRTTQHDYTLLVPRALLTPGDYTLQIYGRSANEREPLESYELRVEP